MWPTPCGSGVAAIAAIADALFASHCYPQLSISIAPVPLVTLKGMLQKYTRVSYELLRPDQVRLLREAAPIAYLPLGTLEWHGHQNPLGTDGLKAHAVCCEAALKHGGIVLPPLYQGWMGYDNWGPAGCEHYGLGYNEQAVIEGLLMGTIRALMAAGWKMIVGVTGHDVKEQVEMFERALCAARGGFGKFRPDAKGFALFEGGLHTPDENLPYAMDHAGAWETSCMMYAYPESVDLEELRKRGLCTQEDLKMSGPEGIGGKNPLRYASAELGQKILERMGDLVGRKAQESLKEAVAVAAK